MVETISPVVYGGNRFAHWRAVAVHALGAALTAAALGLALGALGGWLGAPWGAAGLSVLAAVAGLYLLREALGIGIPVPAMRRQVPAWWRTFYSPLVAAFLYGAGLGVGFLTFLTYATYVAVVLGAFLSGDPVAGALICTTFAVARAAAVGVVAAGSTGDRRPSPVDRLEELATTPAPRAANALALAAIALAALAAAT